MALVQELVKLHGGSVRVASGVDQGSTFTVSIPTGKAHLPADRIGSARTLASTALDAGPYVEEALRWLPDAESLPLTPPGHGTGLDALLASSSPSAAFTRQGDEREPSGRARILWADDNADMRDYVRRLLSRHGPCSPVFSCDARNHRPPLYVFSSGASRHRPTRCWSPGAQT